MSSPEPSKSAAPRPGASPAWISGELLVVLGLAALLGYWQWQYRGYVKDDAFISLRYARNIAEGLGVVFNPGDRLEGYTNFLWILLSVPAFWLGVDPLTWVKVLASVFAQGGLFLCWFAARFFGGDRWDGYTLVAPALWASSSSVVLWSQGGLEPPLMALLCSGGTLLAMMLWSRTADTDPDCRALAIGSAVLLAAAGFTRPDAHAFFILAGGMALIDVIRRRSLSRWWLLWAGIVIAILAPYHLWRFAYFGDLFPNTMYVKASAGPEVWARGRAFVASLWGFNVNAGVFGLALVSLIGRTRWGAKIWGVGVAAFFMLYMVKIGRDEMKWFRLFLPLYPLVLALAADGMRQIGTGAGRLYGQATPTLRAMPGLILAALATAWMVQFCVQYTASKAAWHGQYVGWSERSFQKMGAYAAERSEPGAKIAFQDMGAAPFAGGDLIWIDTIGILNRFVGEQCSEHRVNPFMKGERRKTPGGREAVKAYEKAIRDHVIEQEPEWMAFIAYVSKSQRKKFKRKVRQAGRAGEPVEPVFAPYLRRNGHAQGIFTDPRFQEDYVWEAHWRRNNGYWVVLYRRSEG